MRQPTSERALHPKGKRQPGAREAAGSNPVVLRIGGFLDAVAGTLDVFEAERVTALVVRDWLLEAARLRPEAERIHVVLDNLPLHHHPTAVAAFEIEPRLNPLYLPTYAPWLNPIEKVWRRAKQNLVHNHPWAGKPERLRKAVLEHLRDRRLQGKGLLRYVGLSVE